MSKELRGTKRLCESCGNRFYDLGRDPIVCPVCETPFVLDKPKAKPEAAKAEVKDTEPVVEEKAVVETEESSSSDPEIVSLEEAAAEEGGKDGDDLADIDGDNDDAIASEEAEDVFLEDDEDDDGSDVTGIIGGPIDPKD